MGGEEMTIYLETQRPIPKMCLGCARDKGVTCEVISNPEFIYEHRGKCFARVNGIRAREIEKEIAGAKKLEHGGRM
jgi:hypothetical protein